MATDFERSLEFVLAREGGYVDDPADPGGATYAGVSLRAVVGLKDENGKLEFDLDGDGDVDADDIRKLEALHKAGDDVKLERFYRQRYWARGPHLMPWPLSMVLFDAGVNHGPAAAALMLQRSVGVKADGIVGPGTVRAVIEGWASSPGDLVRKFLLERVALYYRLATERGMAKFFRGWIARLLSLQFEAFAKRSN